MTQQNQAIKWHIPTGPVPQHVVQMIPVDPSGLVLVMHRSERVRSARNVWSFPSGLHDVGETAFECAKREMFEEYGLDVSMMRAIGQYENIGGDTGQEEQYHWIISLVGVLVRDVKSAVNHEPDKHDKMLHISVHELADVEFYHAHPFHDSFQRWVLQLGNRRHMHARLCSLIVDGARG